MVGGVRDVQVAFAVHREAVGEGELGLVRGPLVAGEADTVLALRYDAHRGADHAVSADPDHPPLDVIRDIEIALAVRGDRLRGEAPVTSLSAGPPVEIIKSGRAGTGYGAENTGPVHLPNAEVPGIRDEQVPGRPHGNVGGP